MLISSTLKICEALFHDFCPSTARTVPFRMLIYWDLKVVTSLGFFLLKKKSSIRAKSASFWVKLGREGGID